jgi:hypothetical protein
VDTTLEPPLRRAASLTDYAWKFRYPGEPEEPSIEEADEALALAREKRSVPLLLRMLVLVQNRRRRPAWTSASQSAAKQ